MQQIEYDWLRIESMIHDIVAKITANNPKRTPVFVGIKHGSVIPAMLLKQQMEGFFITVNKFCFTEELNNFKLLHDIILVDEISDTGKTIDEISRKLDILNIKYETAVLVDKGKAKKFINYIGMKIDTENWIKFPWEK